MKKITIKDVAQRAGVNPSTVSRALNNSLEISPTLSKKIKEIAAQIGYKTNLVAKSLRLQRSSVIGLIIPDVVAYFVPNLIIGISKILNQYNYKLVLLLTKDSEILEEEHIKFCVQAGVDGILISLSKQTRSLNHLNIAKKEEIPIVIFDKVLATEDFDTVVIDDIIEAGDCAEKIVLQQPKHIVSVYGDKRHSVSKLRQQGFEERLATLNYTGKYKSLNGNDIKHTAYILKDYLLNNKDVDAIFCQSDENLIGVHLCLELLEEQHNIMPYLCAISDGVFPNYLDRSITYLKHDANELGAIATEKLLQKVFKKDSTVSHTIVDIDFVQSDKLFF